MPFDLPGGWRRRTVTIVDRSFDLMLPADPDGVLETLLEAAESSADGGAGAEPDPYWATLWSSATPTAEAVLQEDWRGDESVLEIGCGMGLVGLAALARGLQVTFSDYIPQALQMALANACRNGYPAAHGLLLDWNCPSEALAGSTLLGDSGLGHSLQWSESSCHFADYRAGVGAGWSMLDRRSGAVPFTYVSQSRQRQVSCQAVRPRGGYIFGTAVRSVPNVCIATRPRSHPVRDLIPAAYHGSVRHSSVRFDLVSVTISRIAWRTSRDKCWYLSDVSSPRSILRSAAARDRARPMATRRTSRCRSSSCRDI